MLRNRLWIILLLLISIGVNLKAEEIPEKVKLKIVESYSNLNRDPFYLDHYKRSKNFPFTVKKSAKTYREDLDRYIYTESENRVRLSSRIFLESIIQVSDNLYHIPSEYNLYVINEEDNFTKKNAEVKINNFINLLLKDQNNVIKKFSRKDIYAKYYDGTESKYLNYTLEVITTSKSLPYDIKWQFLYIEDKGIIDYNYRSINHTEDTSPVQSGGFLKQKHHSRSN